MTSLSSLLRLRRPKPEPLPDYTYADDERVCANCGRTANRHGKMSGRCFRDGRSMQTKFEPVEL